MAIADEVSELYFLSSQVETTMHRLRQATPSEVQHKNSLMVTPAHSIATPPPPGITPWLCSSVVLAQHEMDKGPFMPHKNSSDRLLLAGSSQHSQRQSQEQQRKQRENMTETTASGNSQDAQTLPSPDLTRSPRLYFG